MTRAEIQDQINTIRQDNNINLVDLKPQISSWLDEGDLSTGNLSHAFIRDHILEDLVSYEGVDN